MIEPRMQAILRELASSPAVCTSEHLAQLCHVSSRTIRSDMKTLTELTEHYGAEISSTRGVGFTLVIHDHDAFEQLMNLQEVEAHEQGSQLPIFQHDRVRYVLKKLLLATDYLKIEAVADELFISRSTLQNDMRDVKAFLSLHGILLDLRMKHGVKIRGNEFNIRVCLTDLIYEKMTGVSSGLSVLSEEFPDFGALQIEEIRAVIVNHANEHGMSLSYLGLNHLILQLVIARLRLSGGHRIEISDEEISDIFREPAYQLARSIFELLPEAVVAESNRAEMAFFTLHLLSIHSLDAAAEAHGDDHLFVLNVPLSDVAKSIVEEIEANLGIDFSGDQVFNRNLISHLKSSVYRYKYGIVLPNPLLKDIKTNYPIAFQAAIFAGKVINDYFHVILHENDLGYLALHIGATIEKGNPSNQQRRAFIVSSAGSSGIRMMVNRLESKFGTKVVIVGAAAAFTDEEVSGLDVDFVISTLPIDCALHVVEVNPILSESDLQAIQRVISNRIEQVNPFLDADLVFFGEKLKTREEALKFLNEQLQARSLVPENYLEKVYERELASSTAFGNLVALPHPIMAQTESTFLTVVTLAKPIDWDKEKVQVVILVNVAKNQNNDLQHLYKSIVKVVEDFSMVQQLIKCRSYNDLVSHLHVK